jgi:hypothetical protein
MAEHQAVWPMTVLCEVLEVSRSGFHTYLHRQKTSVVDVAEGALVARAKAIAAQTHHSYGSRRMAQQLQHEGYAVGRYNPGSRGCGRVRGFLLRRCASLYHQGDLRYDGTSQKLCRRDPSWPLPFSKSVRWPTCLWCWG